MDASLLTDLFQAGTRWFLNWLSWLSSSASGPPLLLLLLPKVHYTVCNISHLIATSGIVLSGGYGALTSVEVIDPSTGQSCSLPSLPEERQSHTMDGLLICGGYRPSDTTCLSFSSGGWITSNTLVERRYRHTSWQTDKGVVLMGGIHSDTTSEIVPMDGEQGVSSFYLRHETRLLYYYHV